MMQLYHFNDEKSIHTIRNLQKINVNMCMTLNFEDFYGIIALQGDRIFCFFDIFCNVFRFCLSNN